MLGHCPGQVCVDRLLELEDIVLEMRRAGFGYAIDELQDKSADTRIQLLQHLPIPLTSSAEFRAIFPEATDYSTRYISVLAGDRAWLPFCVDDFFVNGGQKLWIVAIPEEEAQNGFFGTTGPELWKEYVPDAESSASSLPNTCLFNEVETLRGIATCLVIPTIGTIAFPDLERLQIPAQLPDIPRVRLDNPDPAFLPCGTELDDDHRERRVSVEMQKILSQPTLAINQILQKILPWISRFRPDIQCLFTLPLTYDINKDSPGIDRDALADIEQLTDSGESLYSSSNQLRHIQFLFPYLQNLENSLVSPVGMVTGKQANNAQIYGPWKSIAGTPLDTPGTLFPYLTTAEVVQLRKSPGISVLHQRKNRFQLDDERLSVPALPLEAYLHAGDITRYDGYRSSELMRLLGYLRRQLKILGEKLVFNLDYRDPRPRLVLDRFFRGLQKQGALRGTTAAEGFHINEITDIEGTMIYEIMIAPAMPIDHIRLTFSNVTGEWRGEVNDV